MITSTSNPLNPSGTTEAAAKAERIRLAQEKLQWLDPLCDNPGFQKLLDIIKGEAEAVAGKVLKLDTPSAERERAVIEYHVLSRIWRMSDKARKEARETIEAELSRKPQQVVAKTAGL